MLKRQQQKKIKLVIGNKYEYSKDITSSCKMHNWTAFVQFKDTNMNEDMHNLIHKVKFGIKTPFGIENKDV